MIQQSTTYTITFLMVLTSDHLSPATGKTVAVSLSKSGAAFGAAAGTVTEVGNGWYKCALTTTDTNALGDFSLNATATACDPTDIREQIVAFNPFNIASLGLTNLDATVSSRSTFAGGAVSSVTGAVGSVTGSVGGSVVGSVASVTGAVGSVTANVTVGAYAAGQDPLTQVNTALDTAGTELTAVPGTTATLRQAIRFIMQYFLFKRTVTASTETLYKADSSTSLGTAAVADDGTTFTRAKGA